VDGVDPVESTTEYVHALTGATVQLRCTVAGRRQADVRWRRDDVDLAATGRFQLSSRDFVLDIVDVRLGDAGQYTCRVLDTRGGGGHVHAEQHFVVQVVGTANRHTPTTLMIRYRLPVMARANSGSTPPPKKNKKHEGLAVASIA